MPAAGAGAALAQQYLRVRQSSVALVSGLSAEDTVVQSMPQASPSKWHLAHTTWFFEQFVLGRDPDYRALHEPWRYLFNSYYESVGPMHARPQRGLISRPTLAEVLAYREQVDERMLGLLARNHDGDTDPETAALLTLGLQHEQQHQELLLTDIKHAFSINPLEPAYRQTPAPPASIPLPLKFIPGAEGIVEAGYTGGDFAFDCETPRHRALLHPHAIANRAVSNAEFAQFIADGGYRTPTLWMAEGWNTVAQLGWQHPLYWSDDLQSEFTLGGRRPLDGNAPVCHVSFFEADAFARWAGARLPSEYEWEAIAATQPVRGNFIESGLLHPRAADPGAGEGVRQLFGDVWEWTSSPYISYPGYRPLPGALGEYNGKFMCGQWVLRGGSCVSPREHLRASYRNFFYPADRWQFMGFRLGRDL